MEGVSPVQAMTVNSCWLGHGDILAMDGQCQDEFRHCTDPGSDQERINCHVPLGQTRCCLLFLFKDRSGMLFANVCAGFFSLSGTELVEKRWFLGFLAFSLVPCASCGC